MKSIKGYLDLHLKGNVLLLADKSLSVRTLILLN